MKTVMAFGTFDIFHKGHESYLGQARKIGEKLIVVVARDLIVEKIKGRLPRNSEQQRLQKVKESKLANHVILGDLENRYKVLETFRPDIIALGYDQKVDIQELENKLEELDIRPKIVRLDPYEPEFYKSSKLA